MENFTQSLALPSIPSTNIDPANYPLGKLA